MWAVFKLLRDRFRHDNPDRQILYPRLENGSADGGAIDEGSGYFEVFARRVFLARDRDWFHGQYPTVQSFFTFDFASGNDGPVTIAHAAGPTHLQQVDGNHLGQVIQINHLLCGPVPFRSGSVQMEIALVATPEDDDLKRLISVLGDFSQLVAVPQLSTALKVAPKVVDGVEELVGANGNKLSTGFEGTFVGASDSGSDYALRNSLFLAVNAPVQNFDENLLSFSHDRVLYDGSPLEGVDWILLEIRTLAHRHDPVGALDTIGGPLNAAINALANVTTGDTTAADVLYHSAIAAALTSTDLIQADRELAADEVKRRYAAAKSALGPAEAIPTAEAVPSKEAAPAVGAIRATENLSADLLGRIGEGKLTELLSV